MANTGQQAEGIGTEFLDLLSRFVAKQTGGDKEDIQQQLGDEIQRTIEEQVNALTADTVSGMQQAGQVIRMYGAQQQAQQAGAAVSKQAQEAAQQEAGEEEQEKQEESYRPYPKELMEDPSLNDTPNPEGETPSQQRTEGNAPENQQPNQEQPAQQQSEGAQQQDQQSQVSQRQQEQEQKQDLEQQKQQARDQQAQENKQKDQKIKQQLAEVKQAKKVSWLYLGFLAILKDAGADILGSGVTGTLLEWADPVIGPLFVWLIRHHLKKKGGPIVKHARKELAAGGFLVGIIESIPYISALPGTVAYVVVLAILVQIHIYEKLVQSKEGRKQIKEDIKKAKKQSQGRIAA